jgi:hypothetical protein
MIRTIIIKYSLHLKIIINNINHTHKINLFHLNKITNPLHKLTNYINHHKINHKNLNHSPKINRIKTYIIPLNSDQFNQFQINQFNQINKYNNLQNFSLISQIKIKIIIQ